MNNPVYTAGAPLVADEFAHAPAPSPGPDEDDMRVPLLQSVPMFCSDVESPSYDVPRPVEPLLPDVDPDSEDDDTTLFGYPMPARPSVMPRPLNQSDLWNVRGTYQIPTVNCGTHDVTFISYERPAAVQAVKLYQLLRMRAPPERWSDPHGNLVGFGRVMKPLFPYVNVSPALAGLVPLDHVPGCCYIIVRKANIVTAPSDYRYGSPHLDGDSIYQWVAYPSEYHAHAGLIESLVSGYSIMANWVEVDTAQVSKATLAKLEGTTIVMGNRTVFAAVDGAPPAPVAGWRRILRHLRRTLPF